MREKLRVYVAKFTDFPLSTLGNETLIKDIVDSLELVELLMEIEDKFNLTVPEKVYDVFTYGEVASLLEDAYEESN